MGIGNTKIEDLRLGSNFDCMKRKQKGALMIFAVEEPGKNLWYGMDLKSGSMHEQVS